MVGEKLKKLRTAKGLSQSELGKIAGISYVQIGRYEKDINMPSSKIIKKLADALEVDTDFFFGNGNEMRVDVKEVNANYEKLIRLVKEESQELYFLNKLLEDLAYKHSVRKLG